ncbi:MAG: 50S ribosomal protein L21 [Spirochaetes bacterium]|nr:50S ribosomal protein L21 [Spirochaetota bacterium]
MYAIVEIAGKQYKVEKDLVIDVDKLKAKDSNSIDVDKVLMFVDGDKVMVGKPYLSNVKVKATVVSDVKGKKVRGIKFEKRKNYTRTLGHRQQYTQLKIDQVAIA